MTVKRRVVPIITRDAYKPKACRWGSSGQVYGTGTPRWASKAPTCSVALGDCRKLERIIARTVGIGVLPLQFMGVDNRQTWPTFEDTFTIHGVAGLKPRQT